MEANALDRTYAYFYDGSNWQISLPRIPNDDPIVSSLLAIRPFIIRIGIAFGKAAAIKFLFATGILLNQHLALTCPYHFDPIQWAGQRIPLTKIYVCAADPANPALFSLTNSNTSVVEATLLQRGLHKDRMAKWKALEDDTSDLAIIRLVKSAAHLHVDDHFDPKFDSSLLSKSISIPIFPFLKERVISAKMPAKNAKSLFVCLSHPIRNQHRINHSKMKNSYEAKSGQG